MCLFINLAISIGKSGLKSAAVAHITKSAQASICIIKLSASITPPQPIIFICLACSHKLVFAFLRLVTASRAKPRTAFQHVQLISHQGSACLSSLSTICIGTVFIATIQSI